MDGGALILSIAIAVLTFGGHYFESRSLGKAHTVQSSNTGMARFTGSVTILIGLLLTGYLVRAGTITILSIGVACLLTGLVTSQYFQWRRHS
jgi:hypothetical protein